MMELLFCHTFSSRVMGPLLLLLLLPNCLAEKVCITFNNGSISITLSNTTTIKEEPPRLVTCSNNGVSCLLDCITDGFPWYINSSACLDTKVENYHEYTEYTIELREGAKVTCNLYLCLNYTILKIMKNLKNDQAGMLKLFYIRESCSELFDTDTTIKKQFIRQEKHMIHEVMKITTSDYNYDLKNLHLNCINVSTDELNTDDARLKVKDDQLLPGYHYSSPEIWLPVYALHQIPQEERRVGLVSYMDHSQFQFDEEDFKSLVVRIELLGGNRFHHLSTSVQIIFTNINNNLLNNSQNNSLECCYFDENASKWKGHGCNTDMNETHIICSCSHTTAFSVLLIRGQNISQIHWKILSYISYIGCGISAFFTAFSIVIYLFGRTSKMDYSISIHVSLSGSLFLLNTSFLLTEWGANMKEDWVCVFVAAFMHYCLLCCFTWMTIEAFHLYLMLIKVFNTQFKHYLMKLSLAGWGIPCIIVGISLGVKKNQFYGVTEITMVDSNQTSAICWIVDDSYFYSVNLVYFTLTFIFNSGILVAVASSICRMKQVLKHNLKSGTETKSRSWMSSSRLSDSCRSGLTVMGITCLMGTTWGLAFLGSGYTNYVILYLFCILNSSQGFFIFLWICLSTRRQRMSDYKDRMTSTPMKTSASKSD